MRPDYFRATVVDWTWGLGRTALGGGAFACLKVSLPFNFLACIRATRLGWVEKSRQSCGRHSQTWRPSRFLNCLSLAQSHMHSMHHHMMIDVRGQVCSAAWFWRSPMWAVFSRFARPQFRVIVGVSTAVASAINSGDGAHCMPPRRGAGNANLNSHAA